MLLHNKEADPVTGDAEGILLPQRNNTRECNDITEDMGSGQILPVSSVVVLLVQRISVSGELRFKGHN